MAAPTFDINALLASQPGNQLFKSIQDVRSGSVQKLWDAANPYAALNLTQPAGYRAPTKGDIGPGGAKFGSGLGAKHHNPFDINAPGAGLWAAGYDIRDPTIARGLYQNFAQQGMFKAGSPFAPYHKSQDLNGFLTTANHYYADEARKADKTNGLFDGVLGSILGTLGQVGLGFVPGVGPLLSAGLGAGLGASKGGLLGGVLGAAGGYGAGSLGSSLATHGIGGTVSNAVNGVKGFFGAPSAGGAASAGIGAAQALKGGGFFDPSAVFGGPAGSQIFNSAANGLGNAGIASLTPNLASLGGAAALASSLGGAASKAGGIASAAGVGGGAGGAASAAGAGSSLVSNIGSIANIAAAAIPLLSASGGSPAPPTIADNSGASDNAARNINVTFADQGDYYERLRKSLYDYHKDGLDRDYRDEARELKFELARRGHLGGSPEIDAAGRQRQLYDDGKLRIQGIADNAVSQAKVNDQNTKQNAISNIYAGMDQTQALNNQVAQSQLQSQQIAEAAKGQNVGDTFGQLGYLYSQGQQGKAARRAIADYAARRGGVGAATSGGGQVYG